MPSGVFNAVRRSAWVPLVILIVGCVALIGRNPTYHRTDSVQQDGSNKVTKITVPIP